MKLAWFIYFRLIKNIAKTHTHTHIQIHKAQDLRELDKWVRDESGFFRMKS